MNLENGSKCPGTAGYHKLRKTYTRRKAHKCAQDGKMTEKIKFLKKIKEKVLQDVGKPKACYSKAAEK